MNKADVIVAVAERAGVSQYDARRCVDALLGLLCDQVAEGGEVNLTGYMKIAPVKRQPRTGRNLRTGETVAVPARTGVKIQAGSKLKAAAQG